MHPINIKMIYYWDKRKGIHLEYVLKNCIIWDRNIKSLFLIVSFQDM